MTALRERFRRAEAESTLNARKHMNKNNANVMMVRAESPAVPQNE